MRALGVLLLAAVATAEPSIRWINKIGTIETRTILDVVSEGPTMQVRLPSDETLEVDRRRMLSLVRERESVPRERELLRARLDAAAGEHLDAARPVLERIMVDEDAPPWMREYAAAARAMAAERAGDADALDRVRLFIAGHPESRFVGALARARFRLMAREITTDAGVMIRSLERVKNTINKLRGPILDEYLTIVDGAELMHRHFRTDFHIYLRNVGDLIDSVEAGGDVGMSVVVRSALSWAVLHEQKIVAAEARAASRAPHGPLETLRRRLGRARFELPETRCDMHLAYGRLLRETGAADAAVAEFRKARELAPDLRRRQVAQAALDKK